MYFLDMLLQWFYPPRCVLCGKLIKIGEKNGICIDCENTISWKEGAVCQKCGCNLYTNETYCERCQKANFVFERGIAVFSYSDVREAIAHFKFRYWKRDAAPLGKIMADYLLTYYPELAEQTELLIPVPMHQKKQKIRGFNQSELLTKVIAERIGKEYTNTLKRIRATVPQSQWKHPHQCTIAFSFWYQHPTFFCQDTSLVGIERIACLIPHIKHHFIYCPGSHFIPGR